MGIKKREVVSYNLHKSFFDNVFEPERIKLQKQKGVSLSQRAFTEILSKAEIKINYPRVSSNMLPELKKRRKLF